MLQLCEQIFDQVSMTVEVSIKVRIDFAAIGSSGDMGNRSLLKDLFAQILRVVSRPREFHPRPLAEPDVSLSTHPAPVI